MTNQEIVKKLWDLCNVLRDDGITYHQYVTELTYILFLKMAQETGIEKDFPKLPFEKIKEVDGKETTVIIEKPYSWDLISSKNDIYLKNLYLKVLNTFGEKGTGSIKEIYQGATTNIDEPANLEKIISRIDALDWYSAREEGLGNLYEGLLEKNANEKKSGAGQYFTPRPLIDCIVRLMKPQAGELCNDPACGTFGFMIAAAQYIRDHTDDFNDLSVDQQIFETEKAFTGCELVRDTHRLALMNALLHDLHGKIFLGDTLSDTGKQMKNFDVVLSNPPFGTKKGGERASRDDFTFSTSNKQLNFLQHIYRSLKIGGRAAVVLPDNVLFADGDGENIRVDLMNKCNLHTVLRLPTGIFYAQSVKTNVLFFTRGAGDYDNTKEVWFYDLRTNMPSFGKTNPLMAETFADFEKAFDAEDRRAVINERFSVFTRQQISEKNNSLDLGLIRDDSATDVEETFDVIDSGEEIISQLEDAAALVTSVVDDLKACGLKKNAAPPANWHLTNWGNCGCGKFISGTGFPKNQQGFKNYEIPFYKVGSLKFSDSNGYIYDNSNTINENIRQDLKAPLIPPNSVLFAKIGEAIRLNRRSLNSVPCCIDNNLVAFVSNSIFFKYAYYWSQTINLYDYARATTVPAIRKSDLENLIIPLPPLAEQKRIVERLDSLFAKLDAAKKILQDIVDGYELRHAAILHHAFTGELTKDFRKKNNLSLDDWQEKKLGELLSTMETKKPCGEFFRYIDIDSIDNKRQTVKSPKIIETSNAPSRASRAVDSDNILFSMVRSYLKNIALIDGSLKDCIASTGFFVCRCNKKILPKFLYNFLRSEEAINYLMQFMKGDNSPSIRQDDFKSLPLNLPPLEEQKEITRLLDSLLGKEQQTKEIAEKSLSEIDVLKKNILTRAFRGELGTNDPSEITC